MFAAIDSPMRSHKPSRNCRQYQHCDYPNITNSLVPANFRHFFIDGLVYPRTFKHRMFSGQHNPDTGSIAVLGISLAGIRDWRYGYRQNPGHPVRRFRAGLSHGLAVQPLGDTVQSGDVAMPACCGNHLDQQRTMVDLAEMISPADKTAFERFIGAIRNALWFDTLHAQLAKGIWIAAGFLLVCGLLNLLIHALPIFGILLGALLPIVYAVTTTLRHKPTLAEASHHADNLFNGRALIATATELLSLRQSRENDFSPLIIRQAVASAKTWHSQFKQQHKPHPLPWAALGISLLGIFLILQPNHSVNPPAPESVAIQRSATVPKPNPANELLEAIKQQESTLAETSERLAENASGETNPDSAGIQNLQQASNQPLSEPNQTSASNSDTPNNLSHRPVADQGIGSEADQNMASSLYSKNKDMAVKLVGIPLQAATAVSGIEKGLPFNNAPTNKQYSPGKFTAQAATKSATAYASEFTFSQQHYSAAYFQQIHLQQ